MNQKIRLKTRIQPLFIPLVLACFALLPRAQAAEQPALLPAPPPDGFYTGFNTAEGLNALKNVNTATGVFNSAFGFNTLTADTTGAHNTAVGGQALLHNNGSYNTAVGENALVFNTTGSFNMALGQGALAHNIAGSFNTAMGFQALNVNTADDNTGVGYQALKSNTIGSDNTATGWAALAENTSASGNTANGSGALHHNVASNNTAMGAGALHLSFGGGNNTAVGFNALGSEVNGISNVAVGSGALANATHGLNIAVGADAGSAVTTAIGVIAIGSSGANVDGSCFIGNISGVNEGGTGISAVYINSGGRLGTTAPPSSRRYKKEIKPIDKVSEAILALKPVTFHYKSDSKGTPQFGLIAEEVAAVNPDLVTRVDGEIYTVRYDAVNAMLLNEFLKAHRRIEEQQKEIEALRTLIQKVSDKVEMTKPLPEMVLNSQ